MGKRESKVVHRFNGETLFSLVTVKHYLSHILIKKAMTPKKIMMHHHKIDRVAFVQMRYNAISKTKVRIQISKEL